MNIFLSIFLLIPLCLIANPNIPTVLNTEMFDIDKNYAQEMKDFGPTVVVDYSVRNTVYKDLTLKIWININQNKNDPEDHMLTVVRLDNLTEHPSENVNFKMQSTDTLWRDVKGWKGDLLVVLNGEHHVLIPQNLNFDSMKMKMTFRETTFKKENSFPKNEIPKNIFMISSNQKGKPLKVIEKVILLNEIKNPTFNLHQISQEEIPSYVEGIAGSEMRMILESIKPMAYRADLYRLLVLYYIGGVYLDSKITSIVPLSTILPEKGSFLVKGIVNSRIQNTVMATPPGDLFIKRLIEEIVKNVKGKIYGKDPYSPTGPSLLAKVFNEMTPTEKRSYHFLANCGFDFIKSANGKLFTFHNGEYRRRQSLDTKTTSYWLDWEKRNIYN